MSSILDILSTVLNSKGTLSLVLRNGHLEYGKKTALDSFKAFFGFGDYAADPIRKYLIAYQDELYSDTDLWFKAGKQLSPIQDYLKILFHGNHSMPDIVQHATSYVLHSIPNLVPEEHLLEAISNVLNSKGTLSLLLKNGHLESGTKTGMDSFKAFFGSGNYAVDPIKKYLTLHQSELKHEAELWFKEGKQIAPIQEYLKTLFNGDASTPDIMKHVYSDWMSYLPDSVKEKHIYDILLPGTHDSAASQIIWDKVSNNGDRSLLEIGKKAIDQILHIEDGAKNLSATEIMSGVTSLARLPIVSTIASNWTITQDMSIKQQLEHGIRELDLRVAYDAKDSKFVTSHTFIVGDFKNTLEDIRDFVSHHPTEVVVMNIKPDFCFETTMVGRDKQINDLINEVLGSHLMSNNEMNDTLKDAVAHDKQVISFYKAPSSINQGIWVNKTNPEAVLHDANHYADITKSNNFTHMGLVVTPPVSG